MIVALPRQRGSLHITWLLRFVRCLITSPDGLRWRNHATRKQRGIGESGNDKTRYGYVYLLRSGKKYKIGYAIAPLSRAMVISNMTPEGVDRLHEIRTDDPRGIEAYWHDRFADKRGNGEWFALTAADVAAFKRRKFM